MSQVRKTSFVLLALTLAVSSLTGCGISGPLYELDEIKAEEKPVQVESQSEAKIQSNDGTSSTDY